MRAASAALRSGATVVLLGAGAALALAPRRAPAQPADSVRTTLRTVDVRTGRINTVYSERRHFEAPNWSRDGRWFVVNGGGRLYRVAAAGRGPAGAPRLV